MSLKLRSTNGESPAGFTVYDNGALDLLLPTLVAGELKEASAREKLRVREEEELHYKALREKRDLEAAAKKSAEAEAKKLVKGFAWLDAVEEVEHSVILNSMAEMLLYSRGAVCALCDRIETTASEDQANVLKVILAEVAKRGPVRSIAWPSHVNRLNQLLDVFPNFSEPLRLVIDEVRSAERAGRAPRIPPILLTGSPGIGKTHYARLLSAALDTPMHRLSFDTSLTSSELSGTSSHWSTAKAGKVFSALALGPCGNPVFVLDELDKANCGLQDDATGPLHGLLEPSTATSFTDVFVSMPIDASHITWIATANDASCIKDSIRSRFIEFYVARPSALESIDLAQHVAAAAVGTHAPPGFQPMPRRMAVELAHLTAREMQQAVKAAIAHAVGNSRDHLCASDLPAWALEPEAEQTGPALH